MSSINKVIIIGNVGSKPELKTTVNGKQYCFLSVATAQKWKDKISGEWKETTTWHNIKVYDSLATVCQKILDKGFKVYVEGHLRNGEYEVNDKKIKTTEVVASTMKLISSPKKDLSENVYTPGSSFTPDMSYLNDDVPF